MGTASGDHSVLASGVQSAFRAEGNFLSKLFSGGGGVNTTVFSHPWFLEIN